MKKITKAPAAPAPLPEREPSDAELEALETEIETSATPSLASTPVDLAHMGLDQLAYVRRSVVNDVPVWSIHSAMGQPIGAAPTLEQAWGAIVQNDLQPVFVH